MKNPCLAIAILSAIILQLSACGGGGSGDSGNAPSNVLQGDTRSASTGVRLLHGAIDATPIDLRTNLKAAPLTTSRFSLEAGFAGVSQEPQIIEVVPTKLMSPALFRESLSLSKNEHVSILLYGDVETLGLRTVLLPDRRPSALSSEQAALRIVHATIRALDLQLATGTGDAGTSFGGASDYLILPAGAQDITVRRVADNLPILTRTVSLDGGNSYSMFVTGEVGAVVIGRLLRD